VFEPIDGGIRTVAADPAKLEDPHLIIYNAVLTLRETTVVTNGDQTDTIARFMNGNLFPGYSFEAALATRTYEDDVPNFTPRISGVVDMRRGGYKLSIVKSDEGNAESVQRQTFDYPQPVAGEGHFISTYVKNGAPIPSFVGEPLRVSIDTNDADKFADKLWASLNEDNKVSLFVRSIELETGASFNHVPFDGAASALTAVLGGHVDAVTCSAAEAASNIASGELKVLAVANTERLEAYPDVPTFQEVGVDLTIVALRGLCVNKDPPDDVKKALCDGFEKVINSDACREKIEAANMTYMPLNAQETNDILDSMSGNFEKIINAYLNSAN
jgi:IMP cyclohydrolase